MRQGASSMKMPEVISRHDRDGGYIEVLQPQGGGEMYYRSCAQGMCRYSSDLWQAELYLDQMMAS